MLRGEEIAKLGVGFLFTLVPEDCVTRSTPVYMVRNVFSYILPYSINIGMVFVGTYGYLRELQEASQDAHIAFKGCTYKSLKFQEMYYVGVIEDISFEGSHICKRETKKLIDEMFKSILNYTKDKMDMPDMAYNWDKIIEEFFRLIKIEAKRKEQERMLEIMERNAKEEEERRKEQEEEERRKKIRKYQEEKQKRMDERDARIRARRTNKLYIPHDYSCTLEIHSDSVLDIIMSDRFNTSMLCDDDIRPDINDKRAVREFLKLYQSDPMDAALRYNMSVKDVIELEREIIRRYRYR